MIVCQPLAGNAAGYRFVTLQRLHGMTKDTCRRAGGL
jgi:hypothetical protein